MLNHVQRWVFGDKLARPMTTELRLRSAGLVGMLFAGALGAWTAAGCAAGATTAEGLLGDAGSGGTPPSDTGIVFNESGIPGTGTGSGGPVFIMDSGTGTGTAGTGTGTGSTGTGTGGCLNGQTMCTTGCTDITSDPSNCGGCGMSCNGGTCAASTCSSTGGCGGGETSCSGTCTDTSSDPDNCGTCGTQCPSATCTGGTCTSGGGNDAGGGGSCAHSACTSGGALQSGCDDSTDGIVTAVCGVDSKCCTQSWSSTCVNYADSYCYYYTCSDPACP
jgi:hypothetical protein